MNFNLKKTVKRIGRPFGLVLGSFEHHAPRRPAFPAYDDAMDEAPHVPVVSIVTPSYNHERFLERTIRSVLNQNYPALEYVIQDGGSTDQSVEIIRKYEDRLCHWESVPDRGQAHAIDLGFEHTTGEIMAWLNSDDSLTPGTLHRVARYFEDNPDVDVVYGNRIIINEEGQEVGRWFLPPHGLGAYCWRDYVPQETMFWRRSLWERCGGSLNEEFQFALDWELVLRFAGHGAKFVRLPFFQGMFTTHPSQKSLAIRESQGEQEFARLRSAFAPARWLRIRYKIIGAAYLLRSMWWCVKGRKALRQG